MSEAIRIRVLSLAELKILSKETEEKANAIQREIDERLIKMRKHKYNKLFYIMKKKYGIKNLYSISTWSTCFRSGCTIYKCEFRKDCDEFSIEIDSGKGRYDNEWLNYKTINNNFEFNALSKVQENIDYHNNFIKTNPQLFKCIKLVDSQKHKIFADYGKYYRLFFDTNYYIALTFLLCNSKEKIFCKDIAKLIAQKIFFL